MKATLIFDLPEDKPDYNLANRASEFSCAIDEIRNELRRYTKYDTSFEDELNNAEKKIKGKLNSDGYEKVVKLVDLLRGIQSIINEVTID